jgi:hypothetical protein
MHLLAEAFPESNLCLIVIQGCEYKSLPSCCLLGGRRRKLTPDVEIVTPVLTTFPWLPISPCVKGSLTTCKDPGDMGQLSHLISLVLTRFCPRRFALLAVLKCAKGALALGR